MKWNIISYTYVQQIIFEYNNNLIFKYKLSSVLFILIGMLQAVDGIVNSILEYIIAIAFNIHLAQAMPDLIAILF